MSNSTNTVTSRGEQCRLPVLTLDPALGQGCPTAVQEVAVISTVPHKHIPRQVRHNNYLFMYDSYSALHVMEDWDRSGFPPKYTRQI